MQLPSSKISTKVRNGAISSAISAAIVTIVVSLATDSPFSRSQWAKVLRNPATVGAIVTLVGAGAGYLTTEKAFDDGGSE